MAGGSADEMLETIASPPLNEDLTLPTRRMKAGGPGYTVNSDDAAVKGAEEE